ncbi:MAG: tetratricopeptide repeat protein [Bacteroidia bacterium]
MSNQSCEFDFGIDAARSAAYNDMSNSYREEGKHALAIEYSYKALSIEPNNPDYIFNLALSQIHLDSVKGAHETIKKNINKQIKDEELRKNSFSVYAMTCYYLEDWDCAYDYFQKAIAMYSAHKQTNSTLDSLLQITKEKIEEQEEVAKEIDEMRLMIKELKRDINDFKENGNTTNTSSTEIKFCRGRIENRWEEYKNYRHKIELKIQIECPYCSYTKQKNIYFDGGNDDCNDIKHECPKYGGCGKISIIKPCLIKHLNKYDKF